MAILVDEAIWPWRGRRWAHLVSDAGYEELHAFAAGVGLRRMAFQGDHYDVPELVRDRALALGAEPVRGRDLVRRLRGAGLRLAAPQRPGAWEEVGRWTDVGFRPDVASTLIPVLATALEAVDADWATARTVAFRRRVEWALVVEDGSAVSLAGPVPVGVDARIHDDRLVELLADERGVR